MAADPRSDIDQDDDIQDNYYTDLQDQQEQRDAGIGTGYAPVSQPTIPAAPIPTTTTPAPAPTPAPTPAIGPSPSRPSTLSPTTQAYIEAHRVQKPNPDAGIDPNWKFDKSLIQQEAPAAEGESVTTGDVARNIWRETVGMGRDAVSAASWVADKIDKTPALQQVFHSWMGGMQSYMDSELDAMSPQAKRALTASATSYFGDDTDAQGNHIPTPGEAGWKNYFLMNGSGFVPSALSVVLPEGVAAKFALGAFNKINELPRLARMGMAGANFAIQNLGSWYSDLHDLITKTPDAELQQGSQPYAQLRQTMGEDQAKNQLSRQAATLWGGAIAAGTGAAAGVGLGEAVAGSLGNWGKGFFGFLGRRLLGATESGLPMGVQSGINEEQHQAVQEALGQRGELDWKQIWQQAAQGFIAGAGPGALLGARKRAPTEETGAGATRDPDTGAAAREVFGPPELYGPPEPPRTLALPPPGGRPGETIEMPGTAGRGPVSWRDVNVAPVTRGPEPPPPPPTTPVAAQPAEFRPPAASERPLTTPPPDVRPDLPNVPPTQEQPVPGAQAVPGAPTAGAAREGVPTPGVTPEVTQAAPTARPLAEMNKAEKVQELRELGSPIPLKTLAAMDHPVLDQRLTRARAEAGITEAPAQVAAREEAPAPAAKEEVSTPTAKVAETPVTGTQVEPKVTTEAKATPKPKVVPAAAEPAQPSTAAIRQQLKDWGHKATFVRDLKVPEARALYAQEMQARATPEGAAARERELRGEAAPAAAEPATPGVSEEVQKVREQAAEHLAAVAQAAGVDKLPPKDPRTAKIRAAMTEMQRAFDNANTEEDVLTHLRTQQGPAREGESDIAYKLRRNLAAQIEARYTGEKPVMEKTLKAREAERKAAEEAKPTTPIEEVQREEQARGGAEPTSAEAIEAKATGAGEGGQTMGLETKQEKTRDTTDHAVIARQLMDQAMDESHPMTWEKADKAFGKQGAGRGRPRKAEHTDLATAVAHEIDRVAGDEGQKRAETLRDRLRKALISEAEEGIEPSPKNPSARYERMLADYSPERIAKLREGLNQLRDPAGEARRAQQEAEMKKAIAERAAAQAEAAPDTPTVTGIAPMSSDYVRLATDPRMHANFVRTLEQHEAEGTIPMLHDLLRQVVQDPLVRAEMRPFRQLAMQLLKLSRNMPVYTPALARKYGVLGTRRSDVHGVTYYGTDAPHMVLNIGSSPSNVTHLGVLLHEAVHAVSSRYLYDLERSNPNHPDVLALKAIQDELRRLTELHSTVMTDDEAHSLGYGMNNVREMHAVALSDPIVQGFMASHAAGDAFRAKMSKYGYARPAGRSLWNYFTDWVRHALGMPKATSASDFTFFDHVMRPLQDVAEHAHEYNLKKAAEAGGPSDPLMDEWRGPTVKGVTEAISDAGERLRRDAPWWHLGAVERSRPAALEVSNLDQVVPRYEKLFGKTIATDASQPGNYARVMPTGNPLVRFWRSMQDMAHRNNLFMNDFNDRANELNTALRSLPPDQQRTVEKLIHDASIAEATLDPRAPANANAHVDPTTLSDLQNRYNALPDSVKAIEQSFPKIFRDMGKQEREAQVEGILNRMFPQATENQRNEFRQIFSTKDRVEKFLANPDTSDLARAYGSDWGNQVSDLAKLSARMVRNGWVRGDYTPLRRFGDYAIAYGEHGQPSEGFELYETRGAAEARHAELAAQNTPNLRHVDLTDESAFRREMQNNPLITQLDNALRRRPDLEPHADDIRQMMYKMVLDAGVRSTAARMQRRGVPGASLDIARVLSKEVPTVAQRTASYAHGGERMQALSDMRLVQRDLADPRYGAAGESRIAQQVITNLEKRVATQEDAGDKFASLARVASHFGYSQSLMSLSHGLIQQIDAWKMAVPQIGARHGFARASLELSRGALALARPMVGTSVTNTLKALGNKLKQSDYNIAKVFGQHLIQSGANADHVNAVMGMLERAGLVDHSQFTELARIARGTGWTTGIGRTFEYFTNIMSAFGHSIDATNRTNIAWSSFKLEYAKGIREGLSAGEAKAKALAYSEKMAGNSMPNYNLYNKNPFSTSKGILGGAAAPLTQFKQYGFFNYGVMANVMKEALSRLPSEQRSEARWAFAGLIASHALVAGAFTWIADPLRYIMGAYDYITGAKQPHDYEADLRMGLTNIVGKTLGQIIARGPFEYLTGMSSHRRVGFADQLEIPPLESYDFAGFAKMIGTAVSGASGEDAAKFAEGMIKLGHGDVHGAMISMMPRPIRDAQKAYDLSQQGVVVGKSGRVVVPPSQISGFDVAKQALGFTPTIKTEAMEDSAAMQQQLKEAGQARADITHRWLQAATTPGADRSALDTEIRQYNQDPRHTKITYTQLYKDLENRRKQVRQPFGLKMPRQTQRALEEYGQFANVP